MNKRKDNIMKKDFPLEYLYVDTNGDTYYKRYTEKKEKCNVNPSSGIIKLQN